MANKRRKGGKTGRPSKIIVNTDGIDTSIPIQFIRKCGHCSEKIVDSENILTWETMEFCNKACLEKIQNEIGSKCICCSSRVRPPRLGKLCVRIGYKISQFCNTACLDEYRAEAKVCARCQKDVTRDENAIFADVGDGEYKDFCSEDCKLKYVTSANQERSVNSSCTSCMKEKPIVFELLHGSKTTVFCSQQCYTTYKYSHSVASNQCNGCHKYFENTLLEENSMYYKGETCSFCSPTCKNRYIHTVKKIVECQMCKIQKYSFDLIQLNSQNPPVMICSIKCLSTYEATLTKPSGASTPSSNSNNSNEALQHPRVKTISTSTSTTPTVNRNSTPSSVTTDSISESSTPVIEVNPPIVIKVPDLPAVQRNVATMCKVKFATQETETEPTKTESIGIQKEVETNSIEVQTDDMAPDLLPLPIPIYIPLPMMMYSAPYPVPFPFPIPLPVPIFIPTTKRTFKGVTKRIKKIVDRSLKDPLQDEMLMLAEMVSKGTNDVSSSETESDVEIAKPRKPPTKRGSRRGKRVTFGNVTARNVRRPRFSKENATYVDFDNDPVDTLPRVPKRAKRVSFNDIENNTGNPRTNRRKVMFADDQDVKDEMDPRLTNMQGPNTINESHATDGNFNENDSHLYAPEDLSTVYKEPQTPQNQVDFNETQEFVKNRKRRQSSPVDPNAFSKKGRTVNYSPVLQSALSTAVPPPPLTKPLPPLHELFKKPDSEMHLKYSIGVSAWRQWSQAKHPGRFNPDILKLSTEDLDTSLCLFVNEVQKPNGQVYAPDTIYYLCLGIQQYIFLNGRTDNIFYSSLYRRFTDCLDEIARKFLVLYNDSDFIVTRIEEEHLWESKQLGAHSPQVLLSTLLFFNTKFFNLTMVEEHKSLWFSQVVKNSKYCTGKAGRTKTVVLKYYPNGKEPPGAGKSRRKKGFEQLENEENPLRCPIRLYEFYISKCPENIKGSNECFYLLPETSCLPESSVWYSTTSVPDSEIEKMLNRFKIVREVTMALLAK